MVRNAFAHDSHNYPGSEQERADALSAAWQASPGLICILEKIKSYLHEELSLDSGGIDFEAL